MNRVQKDAYLYSIATTGTDEEMLNENEKTYCDRGWHNVSNDVFRAPSQPLILSNACTIGMKKKRHVNGIQIFDFYLNFLPSVR